jgi:hypothetical protein
MIVVIQCQGSKQRDARCLKTAIGKPVNFVAQPALAPSDNSRVYARPDDFSDDGRPWRQILLEYNQDGRNPLGLYPAYQLYEDRIYRELANRFGLQNLYILSAGWGLISANFLTPYYDITFSQMAEKYKRRRTSDHYDDFAMLPTSTTDPVVFFGSKSYVALFCSLTRGSSCEKTVFYNTGQAPDAPGCFLKKFEDAKRNTNWQYDCAKAFLDGAIGIG